MPSEIAAKRLAAYCGSTFRNPLVAVKVSAIFGEAYQKVFPQETPECVGKESGQLSHMERWYNTLRQSHARFVRKTLSFSKSDSMHEIVTRLFIIRHNLSLVT